MKAMVWIGGFILQAVRSHWRFSHRELTSSHAAGRMDGGREGQRGGEGGGPEPCRAVEVVKSRQILGEL